MTDPIKNDNEKVGIIGYLACYATAIMSPSAHSEFVTSDKAILSRG